MDDVYLPTLGFTPSKSLPDADATKARRDLAGSRDRADVTINETLRHEPLQTTNAVTTANAVRIILVLGSIAIVRPNVFILGLFQDIRFGTIVRLHAAQHG